MKIVLASGNTHKIAEIATVLPTDMTLIPQTELGITGADETGLSFVENAIIKARHASRESGLPAIADDSGIEVDALAGAPGIYSARYAGEGASDLDNNKKLLRALIGVPAAERTARFRCVIVMMRNPNDACPLIATGTFEGSILDSPRGESGFGYDPLFLVPSLGISVAELPAQTKREISHRGQALAQLKLLLSET